MHYLSLQMIILGQMLFVRIFILTKTYCEP